jgi:transcriptional regulator with XRE-family HTH domain
MEFGERLRELREEKNLTRYILADKLSVSYSTVSKYETNIRFQDKETLMTLEDFFDVSLYYLL